IERRRRRLGSPSEARRADIEDRGRRLGSPSEARRADIEDRGRRLGSPSEARRADIEDRGRRPPRAFLPVPGSEANRWRSSPQTSLVFQQTDSKRAMARISHCSRGSPEV
ncbi:MAG: hypothetical protein ACRDJ4_14045, partial [Actinomycetota bacterium]